MMRAKEKHVKNLMASGYTAFRDITDEPQTIRSIQSMLGRRPEKVYVNGMFIVQVYDHPTTWGAIKKVMVRWNDARPVHDWNMLQRIKNDLFGPDRVALEVYPAEENKIDKANLYWLWVLPDDFTCPIEIKKDTPL